MNRFEIEKFSNSAIVVIIQDIMEAEIIIPKLIFDYSINPDIKNGYYISKNVSGDIITLNMNLIEELRVEDDIKTVITYGFIHEIMHMYQRINSKYFTDYNYHNKIEDIADYETIDFIMNNKDLIESRLKFKINEVFLNGIKRQLQLKDYSCNLIFKNSTYVINTITGALCNKLNTNYDYIRNIIGNSEFIRIIFPDKREYNLDINYTNQFDLNLLINLIYLTDFKFIYVRCPSEFEYPFLLKLELH